MIPFLLLLLLLLLLLHVCSSALRLCCNFLHSCQSNNLIAPHSTPPFDSPIPIRQPSVVSCQLSAIPTSRPHRCHCRCALFPSVSCQPQSAKSSWLLIPPFRVLIGVGRSEVQRQSLRLIQIPFRYRHSNSDLQLTDHRHRPQTTDHRPQTAIADTKPSSAQSAVSSSQHQTRDKDVELRLTSAECPRARISKTINEPFTFYHKYLNVHMFSEFMKTYLPTTISFLPPVACFACKLPLGLAGAESGRGIFTFAIDVCYCHYCYSQYYDLVLQPPNDLLLLLPSPTTLARRLPPPHPPNSHPPKWLQTVSSPSSLGINILCINPRYLLICFDIPTAVTLDR